MGSTTKWFSGRHRSRLRSEYIMHDVTFPFIARGASFHDYTTKRRGSLHELAHHGRSRLLLCREFLPTFCCSESPFPKHWTPALIFSFTTSRHLRVYAAVLNDCLLHVYLILRLSLRGGAGNCLEYMVWHLGEVLFRNSLF
mgnify:CR=1 FL=1